MTLSNTQRWVVVRIVFLCTLAGTSLLVPKLALVACMLTLVGTLTLPKLSGGLRRFALGGIAVAAVASAVAFVLFIVHEAVPGIVQGGRVAVSRSAVSTLREIVFAEDVARKNAYVDPDADGVGSALLLSELAGSLPVRGGARLQTPVLKSSYKQSIETRIGPAVPARGYLFVVCLPKPGDGFTAKPGEAVDDERAERRWVGYAWPAAETRGMHEAYFVDEHERILVSDNLAAGEARYAGPSFPPPCDAALAEKSRKDWKPWRGKKPRETLPGS